MKILFVTDTPLLPEHRHGASIRTMNLIRSLAGKHQIGLLSFSPEPVEPDRLEPLKRACRFVNVVHPDYCSSRLGRLRHFAAESIAPWRWGEPTLAGSIRSTAQSWRPDIIHFQLMRLVPYTQGLLGFPLVVDAVDCISLYYFKSLRAGSPSMRLKSVIRFAQIRKAERLSFPLFHAAVVSSEEDQRFLSEMCQVNAVDVIPNGVDTDLFRPLSEKEGIRASSERPTIGILGSFDYYPNLDGVQSFCRTCLPRLRQAVPGLRVLIIGRRPFPSLNRLLATSCLEFTGEVANTQKYIAQCDVMVCPVRLGSGIKNTVLESLAMGKAVVSTAQGVRALEAIGGEHLLVAETEVEMSDAIAGLLDAPHIRRRLGESGRALVKKRYQWEQFAAAFEAVYQEARSKAGMLRI